MRLSMWGITFLRNMAGGLLCFALLPNPLLSQSHDGAPRTFPAVLNPGAIALIKAQQDERVAEVMIDLGSRLEAGQIMLRFVDAEERALVQRAEVRLRQTMAEHKRMKRLHEESHISDELLEQSSTVSQLAEIDLELARIRLAELTIRAPFAGLVAERYVDPGTSVERGDLLLRVISPTSLRLEVMLPEDVLPQLRGQTVLTIQIEAPPSTFDAPLPDKPFVIDAASRTFLLQIEIDNEDERIVPGTGCLVSIGNVASPAR